MARMTLGELMKTEGKGVPRPAPVDLTFAMAFAPAHDAAGEFRNEGVRELRAEFAVPLHPQIVEEEFPRALDGAGDASNVCPSQTLANPLDESPLGRTRRGRDPEYDERRAHRAKSTAHSTQERADAPFR